MKTDASTLPLDERLANYIIEGTKDGLIADLDRKLEEAAPLDIINGPLMAGMDEVGRLFNANELIVAEVLQSAEAMKAAVSHLEQFMEKSETSSRGKVILATVKGDVHDIGKNLVDIILSNNGYTVVNLGIKVPPEQLIEAAQEHQPDVIGLSGLLVKSAQQMVLTADDLRDAGVELPLLVGGAALSDRFTRGKIAPAYDGTVVYCNDAMNGLDTLNRLMDPEARKDLEARPARDGAAPRTSRLPATHIPRPKSARRASRSMCRAAGAGPRPPRRAQHRSRRGVELRQPADALRPAPRLPRPLRRRARRRRREGAGAGSEDRSREGRMPRRRDERARRLAVLRSRGRRQPHPHLRRRRPRRARSRPSRSRASASPTALARDLVLPPQRDAQGIVTAATTSASS